METINVSSLKAQLSAILRRVKNGERFTVVDRATPVAVLQGAERDTALRIGQAAEHKVTSPPASAIRVKTDAMTMLLQDRGRR